MSDISDKEAGKLQRMLIMQMSKAEFDASDLSIGDLVKGVIDKNKKLTKQVNKLMHQKDLLIIALKNQHQHHMDYIPELERTVTELLNEVALSEYVDTFRIDKIRKIRKDTGCNYLEAVALYKEME